jgi:hypothetical protein
LRIAEVDVDLGCDGEALVTGQLQSSILGQRTSERRGEFTNLLAQRGDDGRGVLAGDLDQDDETRMPFADRDGVDDLTLRVACSSACYLPPRHPS